MTTELITLTDIQKIKPISNNVDTAKKLVPFILEAQELDLRQAIGEELYIDLVEDFNNSPSLEKEGYLDLFNGCVYTYQNRRYEHQGIKTVLIYYTYARYLATVNITSTPYGEVVKTSQFSTPVDSKTIASRIAQAKSAALAYQDRVIEFIIRNKTNFPLYKFPSTANQARSGIRINAIGGNQRVGSSYRCNGCGRYSCNCNRY